MEGMQFHCSCCGQAHNGLPALAHAVPLYYASLSDEDRARAKTNDDFCITADGFYFIRAVFEIPIREETLPLEWGVWGSLSEKSFRRYEESFHDDDQSRIGAMFSYFSNRLEGCPDTFEPALYPVSAG